MHSLILATAAAALAQLADLPPAPEPQVTQRLGWHSEYASSADKTEWVELNLGQAQALDAVVLIPPPPTGATVGAGYGFPKRFYIELLQEGEDNQRVILADYTAQDFPNPGLLPVFVRAKGQKAQKVRITATRLTGSKGKYFFALGEVMLLQGKHNLGARIEVVGPPAVRASSSQGTRPDWGRINLVDGHTVLGPPLGHRASPTLGFRSVPTSESRMTELPWVEVDLGHPMVVDEVRLFPAHPPQFAHSHGYGFPVRYQVELREEDNDEPLILPAPQSGSYTALPGDNVVTVIGGYRARYVRLAVQEPHVSNGSVLLALAEMQVWSGEKNVALGSTVNDTNSTEKDGWGRAALVDDYSSSTNIVDWPEWLAGLSQRRELEYALSQEAKQLAERQAQWLRVGLAVGAGVLVLGSIGLLVWWQRQRRTRAAELEALRQRIARDLHDEIGSSLGSIALIAQDILAESGQSQSATARADLEEIRDIADDTVSAMRDITRLIQSDRYGRDDLATLLEETAGRMLRGMEHSVTVEAGTSTHQLPVDRQRDLILIFKEALHNITRHAVATHVEITLATHAGKLVLTVKDNGRGFDPTVASSGMGLTNLRRRAEKHHGRADLSSSPSGTTLNLTLPLHA